MFFRSLLFLVLALPAFLRSAPVFELVGEFARPGKEPMGPLLYVAADGNYYGTTATGGGYDQGTIFRLTPAGQITTLVSFTGTSGAAKGEFPIAGLILGGDGALYGTTQGGGSAGFGTAFRMTTAGAFNTLVEFTGSSGIARGAVPHQLLLAPDGFFYGVTESGGATELGTVFKLSAAGQVTTLVEFTGTSGLRKGASPLGALVISGQVLFGVTETGGAADLGTIFSVTTSGQWGVIAEFTGTSGNRRGSYPAAGLVVHSDGALYGTTSSGGVGTFGTVFRVTTSASFTHVREFSGPDGAQPAGVLFSGADGALYGTTAAGGADDLGTVFKVFSSDGQNWVHSVVVDFSDSPGAAAIGASPEAGLSLGNSGLMVGVTTAGGPGGFGTVFSLRTDGVFTHLASFTSVAGWQPSGGLIADSAGELIMPMYHGGLNGYGTLTRLASTGSFSVDSAFGEPLGENPEGSLVRVGQAFFGVTRGGGANGRGTIFRHVPGVSTSVFATASVPGGARPEGPLVTGPDGSFYGVAREGGANNRGAIIRLAYDGTRTVLASFTSGGVSRGQTPRAPLAYGVDGNLYGVTEKGGTSDQGTIFSVTPEGVLTCLVDFTATGPRAPLGGLTAGPDATLYGTTSLGGTSAAGTVFKFMPPTGISILANFTGATGVFPGSRPAGPVTVALDGTLYGITTLGGDQGQGTVYRISPSSGPSRLFAFTGITGVVRGSDGLGGLLFAPDGLLYGATATGGQGGGGTIFRIRQFGPHTATEAPAFSPGTILVRGSVQTGGEPAVTSFDYGTTPALGTTISSNGGNTASPVWFSAALGEVAAGTTIYYRAQATTTNGTSQGLVRSFVVPAPFDAWRLQHFGGTTVSPMDDSDRDGTPNLAEYALVSMPTAPDSASAPHPSLVTYSDGVRLSTTIARDPARSDITVRIQAADDVSGPWETLATSSGGNPFTGPGYVAGDSAMPGIKSVEIRDLVNITEATHRFLRVHVFLP